MKRGRKQANHRWTQKQSADAQQALQMKQSSRMEIEEKLQNARIQIEKWNTQRAESQARLDELKSRLEGLQSRLEGVNKSIELADAHAREAGDKYAEAHKKRKEIEDQLKVAQEDRKSVV